MKKILLLICLFCLQISAFSATAFELGRNAFYDKNYERSKYYFAKEVKRDPKNYKAHYFLGLSYKGLNDKANAMASFKNVLNTAQSYQLEYGYAKSELLNLENPMQAKQAYEKEIQAKQEANANDNYYNYMLSNHKKLTWKKFPVTVYIEPYEHSSWVRYAFLNWTKASKNFVNFTFVDEPAQAQIVVATTKNAIPAANGGQLLGVASYRYTPDNHLHSAKITVLKRNPENNAKYSKAHFISVLQHEIGHTLGMGHSSSCEDIMATGCSYSEIEENKISERDINTLKMLYGYKK